MKVNPRMFRYFAMAVKTQKKCKSDFILAFRDKSGRLQQKGSNIQKWAVPYKLLRPPVYIQLYIQALSIHMSFGSLHLNPYIFLSQFY